MPTSGAQLESPAATVNPATATCATIAWPWRCAACRALTWPSSWPSSAASSDSSFISVMIPRVTPIAPAGKV